ncbi:MAG: hypothetical protein EBS19_01910 [Spirochaetia bacterium]|nr:hypothetical protein [Spirochaetia bacterium]
MAVKMQSADLLKEYFNGVLSRADHHAKGVQEISLALMGAVIWRSEGDIEVKSVKDGGMGNILWFNSESGRYAMYYNHATISIEMRARTMNGDTLHVFNNETPISEVFNVFKDL